MVSVARITKSLQAFGDRFRQRIFTLSEQQYCGRQKHPDIHFAGRFAAKEAVSKALGTGIGAHLGWLDIHIRRNERTGEPSVLLTGKGQLLAESRGVERVLVSIAHTHRHAIAQALLIGRPAAPAPAAAAKDAPT
jgi:holo-[acyl-carrier protein] synthase